VVGTAGLGVDKTAGRDATGGGGGGAPKTLTTFWARLKYYNSVIVVSLFTMNSAAVINIHIQFF